jgi:uncharacterized protein DUF2652
MPENKPQNAVIFIPDISGFTKFVNDTEISHSQHIIQELLEVILDANNINLSVSEIEGDAVLFYRLGEMPTLAELSEQIKTMFIKFHEHLHIIERDRVCHCGACSTAINLTLKFLTHSGEITESIIREHKKLMGKDVIIAHRLLKNNIDNDEYSLVTENVLNSLDANNHESHFNWAATEKGVMNYEHIGEINFNYVNLAPLISLVKLPQKKPSISKFKNPVTKNLIINAPKEVIYSTIIDLSLRPQWTNGLLNIEYKQNEIPRIGTSHKCEFDQGSFDIETVYSQKKEKVLEIAERTKNNFLFPQATNLFILQDEQTGTNLKVEMHYKRIPFIGLLVDMIFRSKVENSIAKSMTNLKNYCEKQYTG